MPLSNESIDSTTVGCSNQLATFLPAAAVFAGKLRHSASRAQFLAQSIGAIEMDFTRLTRVVEHDDAVGFEMTGARDLNVADSMRAHTGQNMSFHKRFLIGVFIAKNV